jgi:hypothetical protein
MRHIMKFTVLEVTKDITQSQIGKDETGQYWHEPIAPAEGSGDAAVVHKAGDMFVRAEMIQLRKNPRNPTMAIDPNNSRNYVYSKPIWFGKIKGDSWSGDDASPFKKMGDTMSHIVAPMEPRAGDAQSYRRRGMRVRSWKEAFYGQDFFNSPTVDDNTGEANYNREWFVSTPPPDYPNKDYMGDPKAIWTPPIAINLNALATAQSGSIASNTFGQYQLSTQTVGRASVTVDGKTQTAYNGKYDDRIYGRLSLLRPYGNNKPLHGLYALQGWDYGYNDNTGAVYDSASNSAKRFLMVVRGMRLPYNLHQFSANANAYDAIKSSYYNREPGRTGNYKADRERVLGFRFWINSGTASTKIYDIWIGEGFTPWEVREVLGLDLTKYPVRVLGPDSADKYDETDFAQWRKIRKLYIQDNGDNAENTGNVDKGTDGQLTILQKKGFYTRH